MLNFAHFTISTWFAETVTLQQEEMQCHTGKHDKGSADEQGPPKKARTGMFDIQLCKAMTPGKMVFTPSRTTSFLLS